MGRVRPAAAVFSNPFYSKITRAVRMNFVQRKNKAISYSYVMEKKSLDMRGTV
jgi:hypothetical protein